MKLAIFDFDQTIADTQELLPYRQSKNWNMVKASASSSRIFDGVRDLLQAVSEAGLKIGIVTSLPDEIAAYLLRYHDIAYGNLVGGTTCQTPKPSFAPMKKMLDWSECRGEDAFSVGDRCVDTESARSAYISASIGAKWGCANAAKTRELVLSRPAILASTPSEAAFWAKVLISGEVSIKGEHIHKDTSAAYVADLWRDGSLDANERTVASSKTPYKFCRYRYNGPWYSSFANSLIADLKRSPIGLTRFLDEKKHRAAWWFARDLSLTLPKHAAYCFIPGSKAKDHPEYDRRFEYVKGELASIRPDLVYCEPVEVSRSHDATHQGNHTGGLRDPAIVASHWKYIDLAPTVRKLYVVDDVITSGGHFEAFVRTLRSYAPHVHTEGLFWCANLPTAV